MYSYQMLPKVNAREHYTNECAFRFLIEDPQVSPIARDAMLEYLPL